MGLECYFDGSYAGRGWTAGSLVTLAGFAAEDNIWAELEEHWKAILSDDHARPKAKCLHMKEAVHLHGEFSHRNGWNTTKVFSLVTDILMYLQTLDKQRFCQFACTVDLAAHRKLVAEGCKLDDPIEICNRYCPSAILAWYVAKYPGIIDTAHYFFDQGEPFKVLFERRWKQEKLNVFRPSGMDMFWSLIKTVAFADMRDSPPLQAADLLAWATNRRLSKDSDRPGKHLEHIMKQIIPSLSILWDEQKFRETGAEHVEASESIIMRTI